MMSRMPAEALLRWFSSSLVALSVFSCGGEDPILERAKEIQAQSDQGSGSGAGGSSSSSSRGSSTKPPPGNNGHPPPGDSEGSQHVDFEHSAMDPGTQQDPGTEQGGSKVAISGSVVIPEGFPPGSVIVRAHFSDPAVITNNPVGGAPLTIAYPEETTFTIEVPTGDGIYLEAYLDSDRSNGPSEGEPLAISAQAIPTGESVEGVQLVLEVPAHRPPPDPSNPTGAR